MAPAPITSSRGRPSLCVGMATHGDFDGVWFTIQALRMYHPEVCDELSFVVLDNDPGGPAAGALRAIGEQVPRYRYVPFGGYSGTAVRDLVFREAHATSSAASTPMCCSPPGRSRRCATGSARTPTAPTSSKARCSTTTSSRAARSPTRAAVGRGDVRSVGARPAHRDPGREPFEIAMHGLGLFACRRRAWPGLNPRLRGFGGEEGYLHERFRRHGGRVLCHPRVGWAHRFCARWDPYPNLWEDRVRNYLVAWGELGWDTAPMEAHFLEMLGPQCDVAAVIERAREQVDHPLGVFDAVFCLAPGADGCDAHAHPPRSPGASSAWRRTPS